MGGQFSYACCPQSPTEMPEEPSSPKWKLGLGVCSFVVTVVLLVIFVVLYVKQTAGCKSQLWNQTSSADGRTHESDGLRVQLTAVNQSLAKTTKHWTSCREELKRWRENTTVLEDNIRKKEDMLKHLEAVNQKLTNTSKYWVSCQEELKHWRENTTMLENDIRKKEGMLKHLEGEKTRLLNQLDDLKKKSQDTWKQERDKKDEEIRHLKDQLSQQQTSSGMVLSRANIASFLLLILPGLLCSLL